MRLTLVILWALSLAAPSVAAAAEAKADESPTIFRLLHRRVDFKGADRATLKDLLKFYTDRYELTFLVDEKAFKARGVESILDQTITIPRVGGIRVTRLLEMTCDDIDATYLVRPDHIFITTREHANEETGLTTEPAEPARTLPQRTLLRTQFKRTSLADALEEITEQTGVTILIAPQANDKAKTLVTARLLNVPAESAVRLLADMVDLKVIVEANVLYVTTPEKQAAWIKDGEATRKPPSAPSKQVCPLGLEKP